jgi:hypothetical protein
MKSTPCLFTGINAVQPDLFRYSRHTAFFISKNFPAPAFLFSWAVFRKKGKLQSWLVNQKLTCFSGGTSYGPGMD